MIVERATPASVSLHLKNPALRSLPATVTAGRPVATSQAVQGRGDLSCRDGRQGGVVKPPKLSWNVSLNVRPQCRRGRVLERVTAAPNNRRDRGAA